MLDRHYYQRPEVGWGGRVGVGERVGVGGCGWVCACVCCVCVCEPGQARLGTLKVLSWEGGEAEDWLGAAFPVNGSRSACGARLTQKPPLTPPCATDAKASSHPASRTLRQVIESIFYLWRATKDPAYRDWGWRMFVALEKYCKQDGGYSGTFDVMQVGCGGPATCSSHASRGITAAPLLRLPPLPLFPTHHRTRRRRMIRSSPGF